MNKGTPDTPRIIYPRWWKNGKCDVNEYIPSNGVVSCIYDCVYIKAPRWLAVLILKINTWKIKREDNDQAHEARDEK